MQINKVAILQNTDISQLNSEINKYIGKVNAEGVDVVDIKFTSVLRQGTIMDEIIHTAMVILDA